MRAFLTAIGPLGRLAIIVAAAVLLANMAGLLAFIFYMLRGEPS